MSYLKGFHLDPCELTFSVFTAEEIRKISVVKVVSPFTFNVIGNPLPGGLYDPAMGPYSSKSDPCSSCNLNFLKCPGHIGHIELCMLTYNPFFIENVCRLLRISCLYCFKLQLPDHVKYILELQLKLIDAGLMVEAFDIEIYKSEIVANSSKVKVKTETGLSFHPKIAEYEEMIRKQPKNNINTKNLESARHSVVASTFRDFVTKKCIHCKIPMKRVCFSYGKLVIAITKTEMKSFYDDAIENKDKIKSTNKLILADECRTYLRKLYDESSEFIKLLYPVLRFCSNTLICPTDIFFTDVIPVTSPQARPAKKFDDEILEHRQTFVYKNIIISNSVLRAVMKNIKQTNLPDEDPFVQSMINNLNGKNLHEKMFHAWETLQEKVDDTLNAKNLLKDKNGAHGLKQIIEKKEGLIRMHMMGKRVNFACRTVITPDPYMNVDEIGIPEIFALKLTYPVPVTPWNLQELKNMVLNGPCVHPGANFIENEKGIKSFIPFDESGRESVAKMLLHHNENGITIVHRHLLNGDVLLLNRQPTLHRPSIQAHKVRILKGEKTFRLHYSNCKAYNADFDGDEMNAHFPQNEVARSEAYNLANVANNYLVPKDGTPLGGLIQDHMIAGVNLTMRGRFFKKEDYQQLVFQGLSDIKGNIQLLPPSIIKPALLWSGKQVLSTIIKNIIPKNRAAINLKSRAKINASAWETSRPRNWLAGGNPLKGNDMTEEEVIIRSGELLVGILDKTHYGSTPYGLIHCMYELYGGNCSTQLLTSLAKVFTLFLQWEGFTLGVHDILVVDKANDKREEIINECRQSGYAIAASALELPENTPLAILSLKMDEAYAKNPNFRKFLDRTYKAELDNYTNRINKVTLPVGLVCQFPKNNLQLMIQSGAKGSAVNTMQISSLLGQIELEGKRPSLMISGKSLPSFATFETSPKSGGFIDGRFMTGIQPQDFFFHCMAGREGLIDTAVKTSRSGYLQRCLIKHLEGLNVNYDMTVRDSDNSVIQFLYGEDGLDISRAQFLQSNQLEFLDENYNAEISPELMKKMQNTDEENDRLHKKIKKLQKWIKKNGSPLKKQRVSSFKQFSKDVKDDISGENLEKINKKTGHSVLNTKIVSLWQNDNLDKKEKYNSKIMKCPDPITSSCRPDNYVGSVTEYLENLIEEYTKKKPHRKHEFSELMYVKSLKSLAQPGEPVGLLAAQSVGEPSTQMTLNTFHFAGRGEMNVTLGIPRLREVLMMASDNIKTPSMEIPFKPNKKLEKISNKIRLSLIRVTVGDLLESINVKSSLILSPSRNKEYTIRFNFLSKELYEDNFSVYPKNVLKYMSTKFFKIMFRTIVKAAKEKNSTVDISDNKKTEKKKEDRDDNLIDSKEPLPMKDLDESSDDDDGNDDDDATNAKLKNKRKDENDYEDPDCDEELNDANNANDGDSDIFMTDDESEIPLNQNRKIIEEQTEEELNVLKSNEFAQGYTFDKKKYLWCEIKFNLSLKYKSVDMTTILRTIASNAVISEVSGIKRAITYDQSDELFLKTDGINMAAMCKYENILDLNRLYTNDVICFAKHYGIEAAGRVIVKEVQNVFKVYGITVDPRHLLLISDYMTFSGTVQPLNRKGMDSSPSPLQQMSFESSLRFMKDASISGLQDPLESPSSRIMLGLPCRTGTGAFSLLNDHSLFLKNYLKT